MATKCLIGGGGGGLLTLGRDSTTNQNGGEGFAGHVLNTIS